MKKFAKWLETSTSNYMYWNVLIYLISSNVEATTKCQIYYENISYQRKLVSLLSLLFSRMYYEDNLDKFCHAGLDFDFLSSSEADFARHG